MRRALAALAGLLVALGLAVPAHAVVRTTYVEAHVSTVNWPLRAAVAYIDQYTGSHWVVGKCRPGAACVKVWAKSPSHFGAGKYACGKTWRLVAR
ncbi:hypothetical protein AB0H43_12755 [Hamadaea sp. NPDC050747]|uniref:hypothetical protein n=1 Tax=Hamadaea sp. NPDC050747 TaxID=3155789 RepID=UPI0033D17E42